MAASMTSHERFTKVHVHEEPDRAPMDDNPWGVTLQRWRREGLPEGMEWQDYFGVDKVARIGVDNTPGFQRQVIEETDDYIIERTSWGGTVKNWKRQASTPEDIDFAVKTRADWEAIKPRMTPSPQRINWEHLEKNYARWRSQGQWIVSGFMFGFDPVQSRMVGTERFLMAMVEDPEWCVDIFNTLLDLGLALLDMVWERGYRWDVFRWPDDMGYKGKMFFSPAMYRELLKPVHKRAVEWAHAKGTLASIHSCGNIMPIVGDLAEIGIDCLNPIEVKAGMDPVELKREFGGRMVLHGGTNAAVWHDRDAAVAEIESIVPKLKPGGGYIFASDHSIPSSVSLETFRAIVDAYKRVGAYG